ncbi:TerD family protein [Aliivibrio fischeri]|uniref:TerD family protein n=1 Tax=Aliivibrio fischeri TaxID=668 RepID=UPI0012DA014E|nr:TerD family protein [Aliivibrio fischeri]MUK91855.1 TerD family protein [Aliivibrio fischeri]
MSINLSKNSSISLTKKVPKLSEITIGLGWDVAQEKKGFFSSLFGSDSSIDLDASCILLSNELNIIDMVWYAKLASDCGAVNHKGDNRTGEGDGDDEQIKVSLQRLPSNVKHIAIVVNSYTGQTFEKVANAFCRVMDQSLKETCRFTLSEQGSHTGVFIGLLTYNNNEWHFASKGIPISGRTAQDLSRHIIANI